MVLIIQYNRLKFVLESSKKVLKAVDNKNFLKLIITKHEEQPTDRHSLKEVIKTYQKNLSKISGVYHTMQYKIYLQKPLLEQKISNSHTFTLAASFKVFYIRAKFKNVYINPLYNK